MHANYTAYVTGKMAKPDILARDIWAQTFGREDIRAQRHVGATTFGREIRPQHFINFLLVF